MYPISNVVPFPPRSASLLPAKLRPGKRPSPLAVGCLGRTGAPLSDVNTTSVRSSIPNSPSVSSNRPTLQSISSTASPYKPPLDVSDLERRSLSAAQRFVAAGEAATGKAAVAFGSRLPRSDRRAIVRREHDQRPFINSQFAERIEQPPHAPVDLLDRIAVQTALGCIRSRTSFPFRRAALRCCRRSCDRESGRRLWQSAASVGPARHCPT